MRYYVDAARLPSRGHFSKHMHAKTIILLYYPHHNIEIPFNLLKPLSLEPSNRALDCRIYQKQIIGITVGRCDKRGEDGTRDVDSKLLLVN